MTDHQELVVHKAVDVDGTISPACNLDYDRRESALTFSQEWGGVTCADCLELSPKGRGRVTGL